MNKLDNTYIFAVIGLIVLSSLAILAVSNSQVTKKVEKPVSDEGEFQLTSDGTKYTVHPDKLIKGCPGMDCILSIDDPRFENTSEVKWLRDSDLVMGVNIGNETRAYPLRIMNKHEIVNDEVGGKKIAVSYCPLCRSGLVYSRQVNNQTLEFGVSGKLYNANLVMYDRQTETYWSQIGGNAIIGPLVPEKLDLVSSQVTNWSEWSEQNPGTQVLSRNTGIYPRSSYGSNPYEGYASRSSVGFGVDIVDERLDSKQLVYGVSIGTESKAYPENLIREENLIQDTVEQEPVILLENPEGGISVFSRKIGNRTLNFTLEQDQLVDQNGDVWSFNGEKMDGPQKLGRLNSHGIYWFAWSKFHPETEVYK